MTNAGELQNLSMDEAAAKAACANANRADHHTSEGYVRALRVLAHEVPPPVDIALQKLSQLSRPVGASPSRTSKVPSVCTSRPRPAFTEAGVSHPETRRS